MTVFEAEAEPGGMLTVGVPIFRLPRELVRHEIQAILSLGVELQCNMRLGRDFTIASLRAEGYAAIFLGIGLPKGRKLPLPGGGQPKTCSTAWIFCAPSTPASPRRWASASW